ncbi:MAG: hypothetical protein AAFX09_01890 [Pseudomonadota bacterium]
MDFVTTPTFFDLSDFDDFLVEHLGLKVDSMTLFDSSPTQGGGAQRSHDLVKLWQARPK